MSALNEAARGIPEPKYTQIPNALLDNLDDFDNDELRVILVAMRSTLGYHKTQHVMSQSFFSKKGGMHETSARRGIKKAKKRGWLIDRGTRKGLRGAKIYEISFSDPVKTHDDLVHIEGGNNADIEQHELSTPVSMNYVPGSQRTTYKEKEKESKKKTTIAPVPDAIPAADMDDAIYGDSHKVPELVEHDSSGQKADVAENAPTDSVEEKKKRLPKYAPGWGTDNQVKNDAVTALLMMCWGVDHHKRNEPEYKSVVSPYRKVAKTLIGVGIGTPTEIKSFYGFVKQKADSDNWGNWSVSALPKYILEYEAHKSKPQAPQRRQKIMTAADAPKPVELTPEEKQAIINMMKDSA